MITITTEHFKLIKKYIDGFCFHREEGNMTIIKQVTPQKQVSELLRKLQG